MSNNRNRSGLSDSRFKNFTKEQVKGIRSSDSDAILIDAGRGARSGPHKANHLLAYEHGAAYLTNKTKFPSRPRLSSLPFFSQPNVLKVSEDKKKETDQRLFKEKKSKSKATVLPGQHCVFPENRYILLHGAVPDSTESSTNFSSWSEDMNTLSPLENHSEDVEADKSDVATNEGIRPNK